MQSSLPIRFPELQQASTGRVGNDLGESTATIPAALSVYQLLGTPHNKAMELRERSFSFCCMPHISFRVLASYERHVLPHKIGPMYQLEEVNQACLHVQMLAEEAYDP